MAMGLLGKLFGIGMMGAGAYLAGEHVGTIADGARLASAGEERTVRLDGRRTEPRRQSGRAGGAVGIGVEGGGGILLQDPRELLRSFLLEVSFPSETGRETALAPVGQYRYLRARAGERFTVRALPGVAYVDLRPRATLFYGLKRAGLGILLFLFGLVSMLLPDRRGDDDDRDDDGGLDIDPNEVLRRIRDRK